jgi:hypothetical protein
MVGAMSRPGGSMRQSRRIIADEQHHRCRRAETIGYNVTDVRPDSWCADRVVYGLSVPFISNWWRFRHARRPEWSDWFRGLTMHERITEWLRVYRCHRPPRKHPELRRAWLEMEHGVRRMLELHKTHE